MSTLRFAVAAAYGLALLVATGCASTPGGSDRAAAELESENALPDFTVERVNGSGSFTLSEARGEWVVLHFLLKTECPICRRTTNTYAQRADEVPGVRHVFLKPDAEKDTRAWIEGFENPKNVASIYRDPNARLAERFDIPDGYEFHGEIVHYPALVVINPQGEEVFRYVGERTQDRYPFEQFKTTMADLMAEYERQAMAG